MHCVELTVQPSLQSYMIYYWPDQVFKIINFPEASQSMTMVFTLNFLISNFRHMADFTIILLKAVTKCLGCMKVTQYVSFSLSDITNSIKYTEKFKMEGGEEKSCAGKGREYFQRCLCLENLPLRFKKIGEGKKKGKGEDKKKRERCRKKGRGKICVGNGVQKVCCL